MPKVKNKLILSRDDYEVIMSYIKKGLPPITFNRKDAEELELELKKAEIVNREDLPEYVVRLNSTVTIKEEKENRIIEFKLVTPHKANIKKRLISIMSPIGTALIGFSKGQQVQWRVPAGRKTYTIMNVQNQ